MSSPAFDLKLPDEIVRAGAGAGKTTRLTSQVLHVVEQYRKNLNRFPKLVVTTFTRKATQELKERLLLRACETQDAELIQYLSSTSKIHISTIHGVLNLFLRQYGHLAQMESQFQIMSEKKLAQQGKTLLREMLEETTRNYKITEIFSFQLLTTMCLKYSEEKSLCPELESASDQHFSNIFSSQVSSWQKNFKQLAINVIEQTRYPSWVEYARRLEDLSSYSTSNQPNEIFEFLNRSLSQLGRRPTNSKKNPQVSDQLVEEIKEQIEGLKKWMAAPFSDPKNWEMAKLYLDEFQYIASEFHHRLQIWKDKNGSYQMSDLESQVLKIARNHPELINSFSSEWDYWLIDEYQDTSPIQVEILKSLVGERPSFTVGDPQQSIYLFRGAEVKVFKEQERLVEEKNGIKSLLEKNYRSQPELLLFFNEVFSKISTQFSKMYPKAEPQHPNETVCYIRNCPDSFECPGEFEVQGLRPEHIGVVNHVQDLLLRGARYDDICILSRTNKSLIQMAQTLQSFQVPTHVHASSGYFKRREVRDLVVFLRYLVVPKDIESFLELCRSPWFPISDQELWEYQLHSKNDSNQEEEYEWSSQARDVLDQLGEYRSISLHLGYSEALKSLLINQHIVDFSHDHDATGRREANIWKFYSLLKNAERQPGFEMMQFLSSADFLDLEGSNAEGDAVAALEPNCVNLMTVHASKGLQFDHVLLPELHKKPQLTKSGSLSLWKESSCFSFSCPYNDELDLSPTLVDQFVVEDLKSRELQESQRVLYVAMTRAKKSIYLSWVGKPARNSWADLLVQASLPREIGIHNNGVFQIEVLPDQGEEPTIQKLGQMDVVVIPPYNIDLSCQHASYESLHPSSVSDWVKQQNGEVIQDQNKTMLQRWTRLIAAKKGIDFHGFIETWEVEKPLDSISLDTEQKAALEYILSIQQPDIRSLLKHGYREWGFYFKKNDELVEGQIDLWGEDLKTNTIWIVDYKTGKSKDHELARLQLSRYALALKEKFPLKSIKTCAIYPFEKKYFVFE